MAGERIINRNPYLYGPGPVKRVPTGWLSIYHRLPPVQGFSLAAAHAVALGLAVSFTFKFMVGDPQIRAIEEYYKENRTFYFSPFLFVGTPTNTHLSPILLLLHTAPR